MNLYSHVPDPTGSVRPVFCDFVAQDIYPEGTYDILKLFHLEALPPSRYLLTTGSWLGVGEWEWQMELTPVPEPSAAAIIGILGPLAFAGLRLRARSRKPLASESRRTTIGVEGKEKENR